MGAGGYPSNWHSFVQQQHAETFSTLVQSSWQIRLSALEVGDDVGEEGWRELASSTESLKAKHWLNAAAGFNVSASRKSMVEGRTFNQSGSSLRMKRQTLQQTAHLGA